MTAPKPGISTEQFVQLSPAMMERNEATRILAERGRLSATSPTFRERMLDRILLCEFAGGAPLYNRVDDPLGGLWVIVGREVEIEVPGAENAPSLAHFAALGFWFGEGALDPLDETSGRRFRERALVRLPKDSG